ncbi:thymidine kinase [uncultured Gemella sp.]|uniref:thymidine kinase n=1 Tax=uncultured Gemella sp. TaxID=254352 RepID=UPI002637F8F3|nr:thymidine kinase [uncultured Gemella sp.]
MVAIDNLNGERRRQGRIEVICGSMFSGKSEELLRRIKRGVIAKQNVLLFKPSIDNRYEENKVSTHNGNSYESVNIDKAEQIYDYINDKKYDIIGIDEVQFFDDKIVEVINKLADDGVRVIVAGLDMDFKAEPFHPMPEIMAISEMVTKLHAVCNKCGKEASRSQRLINGEPAKYDDPIVVIGASESYEARCRHCHEIKR